MFYSDAWGEGGCKAGYIGSYNIRSVNAFLPADAEYLAATSREILDKFCKLQIYIKRGLRVTKPI